MREIAETMDQAKKHSVFFVEVPPHAEFEIRWAQEPPIDPVVSGQVLDGGVYKSSGPMLIACLTD